MRIPILSAVPACALALLLAGCGNSDEQEVRQWMAQVKSQTRVAVPKLAAPKDFIPFAYQEKDVTDPFNPNKLLAVLALADKSSGGLKPDLNRRKEVLEAFPLDTIKMVGTLQKAGIIYALLQIDHSVYQVQSGQHIGQNFGLVTGVAEDAVNIREIVQDAAGDWVERTAKLELQASKENNK
ncbi:MAG TPA: pilus assembly protein PilP [Janthinobacterium sp.]|jgi:type IV pilus assembly protein PilP|nr:pilus assembly protein PilP [Janthinobacterium sp.]